MTDSFLDRQPRARLSSVARALVAACALALTLSACGGDHDDDSSNNSGGTTPSNPSEPGTPTTPAPVLHCAP